MSFVYAKETLGELVLNCLKVTLPKLFANKFGNIFVPLMVAV